MHYGYFPSCTQKLRHVSAPYSHIHYVLRAINIIREKSSLFLKKLNKFVEGYTYINTVL